MAEATIRKATPEDANAILSFMHATAKEQNVVHAVEATKGDLLNNLDFGSAHSATSHAPAPTGKVLLIESPEGEVAGMAIYFFTFAAWTGKMGVCLEDLYVLPGYRRQGYARMLMQAVARQAQSANCVRMEWLCYKNNDRALKFYKSLGAFEMSNVTVLRLDKDEMNALSGGEKEP